MQVEDVLAIQRLLAEYNHLIDAGEAEAWARLFTPDAHFDPGLLPPVEGYDAIVEFGKGVGVMLPGCRHVVTNLLIDVDGDRATSRSYLQLYDASQPGQAKLISTGIYHDELVRTSEGWRIAKRVNRPDGAS